MENSVFGDKTVYKTRPDSCSEKEKICYDTLEGLAIEYERVSHAHIGTIEGLIEVTKVLGASIHKNLFLCNAQKTDFYLVIMPGEKPFKTKLLSPQLNCSRLSFAPPEYMEELICCTPGSASVLGLLFDKGLKVRLVIDKDILGYEYFGCHPCDNSASLKIKTADIIEKLIPSVDHTPTYVEL
ncbi:MAG: prolyl-tRNA synthetase associated domain-containing protein [Clostridia bacterium]|nr:prolyl-tRNA synthetase associated domain-containing protein [Clostridia bacterium]